MTARAIGRTSLPAVVVVACALVVAGCTGDQTDPSGTPSPATSSAETEAPTAPAVATPSEPVTPATSPSATPFAALPMPGPGGGDMLWPTTADSTLAGNFERTWRMRHGFVDASGRMALPEVYIDYAYCLDASGIPVGLVALGADGSVEVLGLDGSLTYAVAAVGEPRNGVGCVGDAEVWVFESNEGAITSGEAYDLRTGRRLRSLDDYGYPDFGDGVQQPSAPALPPGYTSLVGEQWASDDSRTTAINLVTSAVVSLGHHEWVSAAGPYLVEYKTPQLTIVYDRHGLPTPFGSVRELGATSFASSWAGAPSWAGYYWVTAGAVEGFVDGEGTWYYQAPANRTLAEG